MSRGQVAWIDRRSTCAGGVCRPGKARPAQAPTGKPEVDEEETVSEEELNVTPPELPQPPEMSGGTEAAPESLIEAGLAPVAGEGPAGGEPAATSPVQTAPVESGPAPSDDDRLMAALCWVATVIFQLPVLSVVLLLIEPNKNRPFQRYHSVTSIGFWLAALIYEVVAAILYTVLSLISLGCLAICGWVIFFVPHALALYYAYQAYKGVYVKIPVITELAKKQGWV